MLDIQFRSADGPEPEAEAEAARAVAAVGKAELRMQLFKSQASAQRFLNTCASDYDTFDTQPDRRSPSEP